MWYYIISMTEHIDDVNAKPKAGPYRWKPGESGNPRGMVRGSRHKASLIAESLLEGECERLTRRAIVLPVPVAMVSSMRRSPFRAPSTARLIAI